MIGQHSLCRHLWVGLFPSLSDNDYKCFRSDGPDLLRAKVLSFVSEKLLHQFPAFILKNASHNVCSRVHGVRGVVPVATLLVKGTIDDAGHLCPTDGSGTHRAGLYRDIEGAVGQVFPSEQIGCRCDGLHLGMGCHVVQRLCQIVCPRYDAPFAHHYRPNGDFTFLAGCFGFL